MEKELVICIPGNWKNRSEFVVKIAGDHEGDFIFAGQSLYHPETEDSVPLEFEDMTPGIAEAFEFAGQGRISQNTLDKIEGHQSVAYLRFPVDYLAERERIAKFTRALQKCGGLGVKIESTGVAHEWKRWFELVESKDLVNAYCTLVVLIGKDEDYFYSCGMHHFNLPDAELPATDAVDQAVDAINQFNIYQLIEQPELNDGDPFSVDEESPIYRISRVEDTRHSRDDLFHNTNGIWRLENVD